MKRFGNNQGMSDVLAIFAVIVGAALAMLVAALFLTGLMQTEIWPRVVYRVNQVMEQVRGGEEEEASEVVETIAAADSLEAIRTQLETQKAFLLDQKTEIQGVRTEVSQLLQDLEVVQNEEVTRQAKLLAGMKPEEAAAILRSLDDPTLVAVLRSMNARAAAKVMGKLNPRRLARLQMQGIGAGEAGTLPVEQAGVGY